MFAETITLFNRYHSKLGDTWYPHVLHNVELNTDKAVIIAKYGGHSSDSATLLIHYDVDENGNKTIDDVPFLPAKEWARQTNDKLPDSITFNDNATYFDFFIVGEYSTLTPINDDNYTKGLYNELNSYYDYCFAITNVGCYKAIPHFEILAK